MSENLAEVFESVQDTKQSDVHESSSDQEQVVSENEQSQSNWFYDEDLPGQSNKPDYLLDNFKTVAEQAKAYKNAQKLIGRAKQLENIVGAPDTYEVPDDLADNEIVNKYAEFVKSHGLNQDFFNAGLNIVKEIEQSKQTKAEEEIAKLGENGQERLSTVKNWLVNNFDDKIIQGLSNLPMKAEIIEFFEGVKSMSTDRKVPSNYITATPRSESIEDLRKEMRENVDKIKKDPHYASELNKRFLKAGSAVAGKS